MFSEAGSGAFYSLSGFVVGALVGMTGVGGGSLMTPILMLLFGFNPTTASAPTCSSPPSPRRSARRCTAKGTIEWRIVLLLASGSLPAAIGRLAVLAWVGTPRRGSTRSHHHVSRNRPAASRRSPCCSETSIANWAHSSGRRISPRQAAIGTVILGLVLGAAVTLSSVGAGAIGVTALVILYPALPTSRIVGTDIAHAVPLTLVSGLGHLLLGSVNLTLLGALLLGSIPGVILGSLALARTNDRVIRVVLAAVLLIVTIRLLA